MAILQLMKKFSLLVGALGGSLAGYLLSNKKLRDELANAKDPEAAAKLLGKSLQKDGKKLAKQAKEFMDSEEVQESITNAKKYAKEKVDEAKEELTHLIEANQEPAKAKASKVVKKAKTTAKKTVAKAKKKVSKAKKPAKKAARRMATKVRKVS